MFRSILLLFVLTISLYSSVGKVLSVRGDAQLLRIQENLNVVKEMSILKKDIINTNEKSIVKLLMNDKTSITVGKKSSLDIQEYLLDTVNIKNSKTQFNFFKGAFKIVTGKIGKVNPKGFKLKTKSASIGIRGTTIYGNQNIVFCIEGKIVVTIQGKDYFLNAGEYIYTAGENLDYKIKKITEEILEELEEEFFKFDDEKVLLDDNFWGYWEDKNDNPPTIIDKKIFNLSSENINKVNNFIYFTENVENNILINDNLYSNNILAVSSYPNLTYKVDTTSVLNSVFSINFDGSFSFDGNADVYKPLNTNENINVQIPVNIYSNNQLVQTVNLNFLVQGVANKPTIVGNTIFNINSDTPFSQKIDVEDIDNNSILTFNTISQIPSGFSLNSDGIISFEDNSNSYTYLNSGENTLISIPIIVKDEAGLSDSKNLDFTINGKADAPIISGIMNYQIAEEDSVLSKKITALDADTSSVLKYKVNGTAPSGFTLNSDGTFTFNPKNSAYNYLNNGDSLSLEIPIIVEDETNLTDEKKLIIVVNGYTDPAPTPAPVVKTANLTEYITLNNSGTLNFEKNTNIKFETTSSNLKFDYDGTITNISHTFSSSYTSGLTKIGTASFSQTINSSTENGTYDLYMDSKGEYLIGLTDFSSQLGGNVRGLIYGGTSVDMSKLNDKIYTYKGFRQLIYDTSANNTSLNNTNNYTLYLNGKNNSLTYLDTNVKIYDSAFYFNAGKIDNSGNISFSSANVLNDKLTTNSESGNLYGSEFQGLSFENTSKTFTDLTTTTQASSKTITESYYLDNSNTSANTSNTATKYEGYSIGFLNTSSGGYVAQNSAGMDYTVNPSTGVYTSVRAVIGSGLSGALTSSNTSVSSLNAYYINEDVIASKLTTASGAGSVNDKASWIVSIPDKIDTSGNLVVNNDNASSWGYWTADFSDKNSIKYQVSPYTTWVAGVPTDETYVDNLINNISINTYNFKGNVIGAVLLGTNFDPVLLDSNNKLNLSITFGTNSNNFTGDFSFKTKNNKTYAGDLESSSVKKNSFAGTVKNLKVDSTATNISSTTISGRYYGTNIKSVGGSLSFDTVNNEKFRGSFKADKQ